MLAQTNIRKQSKPSSNAHPADSSERLALRGYGGIAPYHFTVVAVTGNSREECTNKRGRLGVAVRNLQTNRE
jgi:hypothetical protein